MGKINRLNNTIMKKIFFITLLIVIGKSIANAQIKVVDDDYRSSLTAAKSYYDQDVEFEKIFPKAYLGSGYNVIDMGINCTEPYNSIKMTIPINLNCLGDTLWNYSNLVCPQYGLGDRMNSWGFGIVTDGEKKEVIWEIPAGYYTISGYIIGKENLIELLSMHFSDEDTTRILHSYDNGRTVFRNKYYGIGTTPSIKLLKEQLLTQDFKYLPDGYIAYVKLSSVDTINNKRIDYYAPRLSNLFNIKFYNEIRKQFLNQEIILVRGEQIEFDCKEGEAYHVKQDIIDEGEILSDAMTDESLKLADNVFTVMDVVVKLKKSGPQLFVIVRGENTGSFAIQPKSIEYEYYVTEFDTIRDGWRHPNYTNYGYPNLKLEAGYMNKINTIKKNKLYIEGASTVNEWMKESLSNVEIVFEFNKEQSEIYGDALKKSSDNEDAHTNGVIKAGDSISCSNMQVGGMIANSSKDITICIPVGRVITASEATVSSGTMTIRTVDGYAYNKASSSGGTYSGLTAANFSPVCVLNKTTGSVRIKFTNSTKWTMGNGTQITNNTPVSVAIGITLKFS